ncbi:MAG: hypothetical protein AB1689_08080 [Thermodesulfobacteriota bacterium]
MEELVALAAPSWAGEAEIARTYLAHHRSVAGDARFLAAQAWKETRLVRALPPERRAECFATAVVDDHPEGAPPIKFAEEVKHYRLLAGLLEELTGEPVTLDRLRELPAETRLQELRAPYRAGTPLERAVVNFTEGGGGAIYAVLAELGETPFDRRMAAAFREILDDEVFHGPAEIQNVARHASRPDDWRHAADLVRRICRARLDMRNEMFGFPLADARLDEIAAGHIAPWPMPVAY